MALIFNECRSKGIGPSAISSTGQITPRPQTLLDDVARHLGVTVPREAIEQFDLVIVDSVPDAAGRALA